MGPRPLHRLKGTEKLTRSFMSTSMLAPTECAVAELAFVLLFRRAGRFLRRRSRGGRSAGGRRSRHRATVEVRRGDRRKRSLARATSARSGQEAT